VNTTCRRVPTLPALARPGPPPVAIWSSSSAAIFINSMPVPCTEAPAWRRRQQWVGPAAGGAFNNMEESMAYEGKTKLSPGGRFLIRDEPATRPARDQFRRPYDEGNRQYVCSVPGHPENFSSEDDDEAGLVHVHRHDGGEEPQHVLSLPAGSYQIDHDRHAGMSHVYRVPKDENVRVPIATADTDRNMAAMRAMNAANRRLWGSRRTGDASPRDASAVSTAAIIQAGSDPQLMQQALKAINARNRAHYKPGRQ
jgi:hypothetical protein